MINENSRVLLTPPTSQLLMQDKYIVAIKLGYCIKLFPSIEIKNLHFLTQTILIVMTMGDFNTSERASLPNFWVWGFK